MDETTALQLILPAMCLAWAAFLAGLKLADAARTERALRETNRSLRRTVIELDRSLREMDGRAAGERGHRPMSTKSPPRKAPSSTAGASECALRRR